MRPMPKRREAVGNAELSKWLEQLKDEHSDFDAVNFQLLRARLGLDDALGNAELSKWLEQLKIEHRDLDEVIHHLLRTRHHDAMRVQRLKKRKLKLKDMIAKLESELIPDLDA